MRSGGFAYLVVLLFLCSFWNYGGALDIEGAVGVSRYSNGAITDIDNDEFAIFTYIANSFLFYVSDFVDGYDLLPKIVLNKGLYLFSTLSL